MHIIIFFLFVQNPQHEIFWITLLMNVTLKINTRNVKFVAT